MQCVVHLPYASTCTSICLSSAFKSTKKAALAICAGSCIFAHCLLNMRSGEKRSTCAACCVEGNGSVLYTIKRSGTVIMGRVPAVDELDIGAAVTPWIDTCPGYSCFALVIAVVHTYLMGCRDRFALLV